MMRILISGSIGSGKSLVANYFVSKAYSLYEMDKRAKQLYYSQKDLVEILENTWNCNLKSDTGEFMPEKLSKLVFSDRTKLAFLEALLYPRLKEDFNLWLQEHSKEDFCFIESAILLQKPIFADCYDKLLLINTNREIAVERACKRDNLSKSDIEKRLNFQQEIPLSKADFIIENNDNMIHLFAECDKFLSRLNESKEKFNINN